MMGCREDVLKAPHPWISVGCSHLSRAARASSDSSAAGASSNSSAASACIQSPSSLVLCCFRFHEALDSARGLRRAQRCARIPWRPPLRHINRWRRVRGHRRRWQLASPHPFSLPLRREARPSQCDTTVVRLNLLPSGGGLGRGKTKWRFWVMSSLTLRGGPTDLASLTLRRASA